MPVRCVGLVVGAQEVTVVDTVIPDDPQIPITVVMDETWKLPTGDRPRGYETLFHHCKGYLEDNQIIQVVIKASAVPPSGATASLLEGAELRGVIMCAAASVCEVKVVNKSSISRRLGRKVDECIQDDQFWDDQMQGARLRKGSREAAMLVVSQRARP